MEKKENLVGKCPYVTAQQVLSGKWSLLILHYISGKTLRFNELQRLIPDLTQATLTRQLRALEENGLIVRKVYHQVPPKVEYSLSNVGIEFNEVLDKLEVWGRKYIQYINYEKSSDDL